MVWGWIMSWRGVKAWVYCPGVIFRGYCPVGIVRMSLFGDGSKVLASLLRYTRMNYGQCIFDNFHRFLVGTYINLTQTARLLYVFQCYNNLTDLVCCCHLFLSDLIEKLSTFQKLK